MDLVIGATGILGGEVCRRLTERGRRVRGTHRAASDPASVERLRSLGVEMVEADLTDASSLVKACDGISTVISTATAIVRADSLRDVDEAGQENLIDAASEAGVEHFTFISVAGSLTSTGPLTAAKRATEKHLTGSGLTHTILRPTYFQEAWLSPVVGFDFANARVTIYGTGEQKASYISLGDVAEFAVLSLEKPEARNSVVELGGPEAVSQLEAVEIFEKASGRGFETQSVSEEALRAQFESSDDAKQKTFAALMLQLAQGDIVDMTDTLARFPVSLQSVSAYAQQMVGS